MCSTGCPTQDHASWGECIRSKNLQTCYDRPSTGWDRSKQKSWDKRLKTYADSKRQGIQPRSTNSRDIDLAVKISDEQGQAFQA